MENKEVFNKLNYIKKYLKDADFSSKEKILAKIIQEFNELHASFYPHYSYIMVSHGWQLLYRNNELMFASEDLYEIKELLLNSDKDLKVYCVDKMLTSIQYEKFYMDYKDDYDNLQDLLKNIESYKK